jgi:small-conductance mechanosensitive channel
VLGDVYRIDVLNTTVWEVGGPDRPPGSVHAEQPTGRLITFPNNEILTGTVINYTRDFPYVWDELTVSVANESELSYAMTVIERAAAGVIGDHMQLPAQSYRALLQREGLDAEVADRPQVYAALTDWGANLTLRYVVGAREKRVWKSRLAVALTAELNRPEHAGRILPAYPRQQIQLVRPNGAAVEPGWIGTGPGSGAAEPAPDPADGGHG